MDHGKGSCNHCCEPLGCESESDRAPTASQSREPEARGGALYASE